jgi:hypothetical protein
MKNQITHLGITFSDFPLDENNTFRLAKFLLFNRRITASAAKKLIENIKFWKSIAALNLFVQSSLATNGIPTNHDNKSFDLENPVASLFELFSDFTEIVYPEDERTFFRDKLYQWVLEFNFPKYCELPLIEEHFKGHISLKLIYEDILKMLFEPDFPENKIFEFLAKYYPEMPEADVNDVLDMYQSRSNADNNDYSPVSVSTLNNSTL